MCNCVIANLVVSRFPKERDIRKQWVFVVERITTEVTEHKTWVPCAMMCVSVTSSFLDTD